MVRSYDLYFNDVIREHIAIGKVYFHILGKYQIKWDHALQQAIQQAIYY